MTSRRLLSLMPLVSLAFATASISDLRMPKMLSQDPGPWITSCFSDVGGLTPVSIRVERTDGTRSAWLPLWSPAATNAFDPKVSYRSETVRDGRGRTRSVRC